ncbi:MAG: non-heme iron oxygenase ferredoxin subunit [Actinomycetota bacterium]
MQSKRSSRRDLQVAAFSQMTEWRKVASVSDLSEGDVIQVDYEDEPVCLANADGEYLATSDVCSHEYVMLSGGWLDGEDIECPQHGSKFNMRTGAVDNLPAVLPIPVYDVKVEGNDIYIKPQEKEL